MMTILRPAGVLLGLLMLCSCGSDADPNRKATSSVSGKLTVDGKSPSTPIKIFCHNLDGMDKENPTISWSLTAEDGTFALNTYEAGDGVPAGKYALTFLWGKWNPISNSYGGKDQLKDRYSKPEESKIQFEADGETPIDLGTIELTTK